jgi:glycosyltransferase involved in cell wall biosynthesis
VVVHAVATVFNEEHIIDRVLSHLYGEGVTHVWVADASTDTTRDYYRQYREHLTVIHDMDPYHYQPKWINRLAQLAAAEGAEWVIPFDADEFWYSLDGQPVAERLASLDAAAVTVQVWQHFDWEHRNPNPQGMGKVAFRPTDRAWVANGNHSVSGVDGPVVGDVLGIRELQFASLDHLHRKSRERVERLDPALPESEGSHQRVLDAGGDEYRASEWDARKANAAVVDPIPYRGTA